MTVARVVVGCDDGLVVWSDHDGLHVVPKPGSDADRLWLMAREALKVPQQVLAEVPVVHGSRFNVERQWVTEPLGSAKHAMAALRGLPGARLIEYLGD
jgi:hypothetical protein